MDIKDKVVIVTGASGGIGLAAARLLTRGGAKVALVARSRDKLEKAARELQGSLAVRADMSRPKDIAAMVEKVGTHFGRIDVLVNNAGRGYDAPVERINLRTLREIFELDLAGPVAAMQAVIPAMRARGGGVIVNVSSGTALMYLPDMGGYSSVKRALAHISLTARAELERDHIAVCVVYPFITLTDFEANTIKDVVEGEPEGAEGGYQPPPADTAEYAAGKILDAVTTEEAEVFAHDWMRRR